MQAELPLREEFLFLGPLSSWESNILGRIWTIEPGSSQLPCATIYYCCECGTPWGGRIPCQGPLRFYYHNRECRAHGNGSLTTRFTIWDSLPDSVAMYEIAVFNPNLYSRFYK